MSGQLPERFGRRWRLIGAGLSNIWRFGDLELPAASGRLLLRGPNGTGKTTALEILAPYLLDLNATRLSAGKARTTNLSSLMREGSGGKRRCGYAWLTLDGPEGEGIWSFGARVHFSDGSSPPVKVTPFAAPGRPLRDFKLHGSGRAALTAEQFTEEVLNAGGRILDSEEDYVTYLAARVFGMGEGVEVAALASRLRQVRNPALLGDVSPQAAADALRESLPGVAEDVINATADALAESEETRKAFELDREAALLLRDFSGIWCAHATEVAGSAYAAAAEAARYARNLRTKAKGCSDALDHATATAEDARKLVERLDQEISDARTEIETLEKHQAYKDAGRLSELKKSAAALTGAASNALSAMREAARSAAERGESLRREIENLIEDLAERAGQVRDVDPGTALSAPLLSYSLRPRTALRAGETFADAGPEILLHGDSARLRAVAGDWEGRAQEHASRAEAAALAISDFGPVDILRTQSEHAAARARDSAAKADDESAKLKRAEGAASEASRSFLLALGSWTAATKAHSRLRDFLWSAEDIERFLGAEPGQVLGQGDAWAKQALTCAEQIAGELRAGAGQAYKDEEKLRDEARLLREESDRLRSGRLLPFPRPEWAGPSDDALALGAALDWSPGLTDPRERALLEAALSASGILGASLGKDGAATRHWRVDGIGPPVQGNLLEAVSVDPGHPLGREASAVLSRIRLATSAPGTPGIGDTGVVIGRDGSFRAGVLSGRMPGADQDVLPFSASHIGARQRREAALARAAELDAQATRLEEDAVGKNQEARKLASEAETVSSQGQAYPSRELLREAESNRSAIARIALEARDGAEKARREEERIAGELRAAMAEWLERTRSRGLPGDIEELRRVREHLARGAELLRRTAGDLRKSAERLTRAADDYSNEAIGEKLHRAEREAQEAHRADSEARKALEVLEETAGAAIAEILERHAAAEARLRALRKELDDAGTKRIRAERDEGEARGRLELAEEQLREALPRAAHGLDALRALLSVHGVADAVLDGEVLAPDERLLAQVESKLQGRKTAAKKTVRERYDALRAKLAGIWSVDPGDDHGELLTYVLMHKDSSFTPTQAALEAESLKGRAERALAASEERALRDFVIGRLPGAIGAAWTRLHDWVAEVNRKMRFATASSGVGVQVRATLRDDLAPAFREVYELSCKASDAERTPDRQKRLSDAFLALLGAADGETMHEKLFSAVNVRDWVDVNYEITRPGGKTQRWGSKTSLSTGERRLVALAPMIAAIAASYDRFGDKALRLLTLDEVPAEVDERGREGLARYIAQLDLDLLCTSYLWDGSPGAWDGIDAHDLEGGPDGTVVAFPMLVRGLLDL